MKRLSECPAPRRIIIDGEGNEITHSNPLPIGEGWEIVTVSDETDNDNDKSFAVDAGYNG